MRRVEILPVCVLMIVLTGIARNDAQVVVGGNQIYRVFTGTSGSACGTWTATTGPLHPAGPGLSVLYGSGKPQTSSTVLRSYSTGIFYRTGGNFCTPLCNVVPPVISAVMNGSVVVGHRFSWTFADGPTTVEFVQEAVVEGPVNGTETVGNTVIRETHTVRNLGPATLAFGLRKFWDWQIAADDGPHLGLCDTPNEGCDVSMNLTANGTLNGFYPSTYVMNSEPAAISCPAGIAPNNAAGCSGTALYVVAGTVKPPSLLSPPPDPPELLQFNSWAELLTSCWQPALLGATTCGAGFGDNAIAYFYGLTAASALALAPGQSRSLTQYVVASQSGCPGSIVPEPCPGILAACAGTHWISLPGGTGIATAEDLCTAVGPAAVSVTQQFPEGTGSWTHTCGGGCAPGAGAPPTEPGCSSSCFCIDDGEGYEITTNAPSSFKAPGCDPGGPIVLPAGGQRYLISVPCDTNLVTFQDLAVHLGLPPLAGMVHGRNGCLGVTTSCAAGTACAASNLIIPGQAYRVDLGSAAGTTFTNPTAGGHPCPEVALQGTNYCITGDSTGQDYAWWIDNADGIHQAATEPRRLNGNAASSAGSPPSVLASELAGQITTVGSSLGTTATASGSCLAISTGIPNATLRVGPPNNPDCVVTASGCPYNPKIMQVPPAVPAFGGWGAPAAILLLLTAAVYLVHRRRIG